MQKFVEKTTSTKEIFQGRVITLQVDEVVLPNGQMSTREIVKHPGAVAIIAITNDNKLVLVEQYRKPMEKSIVEIPAGKLDPGEDRLDCAYRELEEETGYGCQTMEHLISFYTSPGFADEIVHVYMARGLSKIENARTTDDDEFVELLEVTLAEACDLVKDQKICDAKTAYAVQYLQLQEALTK